MSTTYDDLEKIAMKLEPAWGELVLSIVEAAHDKFVECGAGHDFCLQSTGPSTLIFGSRNRLVWTASNGFVPDRSYCTTPFLAAWDVR
jgi:hypothetical protein